jgi:hypothetical protein
MLWTHRRQHHALVAVVAFVGLIAFLAIPQLVSAKSEVPFHATIVESGPPPVLCGAALLCIGGEGSGQATHLGRVTEVGQVIVDLASQPGPTPDCHTNTRTVTLTAANGDQLTLGLTGISCDTGATSGITGISHDTWVVTGGTGRFSGATGSGTDTVSISALDGTSRTVFTGTLSMPGSR